MFLSLDTSHGASVALLRGYDVLGAASNDDPRQHTESLTPMIQRVLQQANVSTRELTGVVVGTGPAPFTGLRVGLITARTLALALGIPVYGVPALAAVARGVFDVEGLERVTIVTDARRKEVYWARYAPNGEHDVVELTAPAVARPDDLVGDVRGENLRGRGVGLYPDQLPGASAELDPGALGRIARVRVEDARARGAEPDLPTEPLYLRRPDIHQSAGRKRAS